MRKLNHYLLAATSLALLGLAGAPAQATTCFGDLNCSLGTSAYTFGANDVWGGGSTLIAPYFRQMADCYSGWDGGAVDGYADLISKGSDLVHPQFVDTSLFNYPGLGPTHKGAQNCASAQGSTGPHSTSWYLGAGSGNGIASFYSHDPASFFGDANLSGPQTFPEMIFAMSDAGLSGPGSTPGTDVYIYYNGGSEHGATIGTPNQVTCTSGSKNPYPNPAQCYGPLIQYPISVDAVAIAFPSGGVYEKVAGAGKNEIDYKFRTSTIKFSTNTMCMIWNGQITNWNDSHITADNGGSLESTSDPTPPGSWSVPLYAVGRFDGSGTTSIITRHLAATCQGLAGNQYANGSSNLPGTLVGNQYITGNPNYPGVDLTGKITVASGSGGVATYTAFTQAPQGFGNQCAPGTVLPNNYSDCIQQARVAYIGADYVVPYVKNSRTNTYNLYAAELQNHATNYEKVSPTGALTAFTGINPPQTDSKGHYCPSCGGDRTAPDQWVESPDKGQPLADPLQSAAYPLVGTTNVILYQCYAATAQEGTLVGQLDYIDQALINTDKKNGVLAVSGLGPLPSVWLKAINQSFLIPNGGVGSDGLGLSISVVNAAGAPANCTTAVNPTLIGG